MIMPKYDYTCIECDYTIEVTKSFSDADTTQFCEKCGNPMNKVYGSVGVQFKGTGFYKTDNPK
jgi:putative FmdB family regulatory protein